MKHLHFAEQSSLDQAVLIKPCPPKPHPAPLKKVQALNTLLWWIYSFFFFYKMFKGALLEMHAFLGTEV